MTRNVLVHGAGGGGGGGGAQQGNQEAPNTLRSTATAKLIDLLCEGPILGLVEEVDSGKGAKSITINDVPVMNNDESLNFQGFSFQYRLGTDDQTVVPGFDNVSSEYGVELHLPCPRIKVLRLIRWLCRALPVLAATSRCVSDF